MATKQNANAGAPDGSQYVTITDGSGNLVAAPTGSAATVTNAPGDATNTGSSNATNSLSLSYVFNGTTWDRARSPNGVTDGSGGTGMNSVGGYAFNGTNWDRTRSLGGYNQAVTTGTPVTVLAPNAAATSAIAYTSTTVAAGSIILKATAGNLYSVNCTTGASAGYLLIFDSATVPADGVVTPVFSISLAANTSYSNDWAYPIRGTAGLVLVFSTTGPYTKTISATAQLGGQFI